MASNRKVILAVVLVVILVVAPTLGFALTNHQPNQTVASNAPNNLTEPTPSGAAPTSTPTNTPSSSPNLSPTAIPSPAPALTPTVPAASPNPVSGDLELSMSLEKAVFNFGEPVNVTLVISNISQKTVSFEYSAFLDFDFTVYNGTNNLVYQWSFGQVFPMVLENMPLAPGHNVTETYVWPQTLKAVNDPTATAYPQVSPGTYFIVGESPVYHLQTAPTQVTILPMMQNG